MTGNESCAEGNPQMVQDAQLLEQFEIHRDFTRIFIDSFVLLNASRKILKFNQMFCTTVGARAIDVRRANSIDELLTAEIPGTKKSAIDLIFESNAPLRVDEVLVRRKNQEESETVQAIIGSYPFLDEERRILGVCLIIRDVTAENNLQGKYKEKTIQSITDPLTGLFTRRYFEDVIDRELERCQQYAQQPTLGVLMFDLDKFKIINDTYGHQAGDFVLAETARVLRENSRKSDIVGRYGGEELLIILSGATTPGCCMAAEKFRQAIQNNRYVFQDKVIPVTASVGVSIFLTDTETRLNVVARADACLYAAKHAGRNIAFADFGGGPFPVTEILKSGGFLDAAPINQST